MVTITAETIDELAEVQDYIIIGMLSKGKATFEGSFSLSSGNNLLVQNDYFNRIIGEHLPDGSVRYVQGYKK